jgi:hypothetical protein
MLLYENRRRFRTKRLPAINEVLRDDRERKCVRKFWLSSGDIGLGLGAAGVNVLVGGSGRSFALQPVSVEGSIAINVTVGLSGLQLRPIY